MTGATNGPVATPLAVAKIDTQAGDGICDPGIFAALLAACAMPVNATTMPRAGGSGASASEAIAPVGGPRTHGARMPAATTIGAQHTTARASLPPSTPGGDRAKGEARDTNAASITIAARTLTTRSQLGSALPSDLSAPEQQPASGKAGTAPAVERISTPGGIFDMMQESGSVTASFDAMPRDRSERPSQGSHVPLPIAGRAAASPARSAIARPEEVSSPGRPSGEQARPVTPVHIEQAPQPTVEPADSPPRAQAASPGPRPTLEVAPGQVGGSSESPEIPNSRSAEMTPSAETAVADRRPQQMTVDRPNSASAGPEAAAGAAQPDEAPAPEAMRAQPVAEAPTPAPAEPEPAPALPRVARAETPDAAAETPAAPVRDVASLRDPVPAEDGAEERTDARTVETGPDRMELVQAHEAAEPRAVAGRPEPARVHLPRVRSESLRFGETQRLTIEVDPPELGRCELELTLIDERVRAVIVVERPETVAAMRSAEAQVREALAGQQLEVAQFDVHQGGGGAGGQMPGQQASPPPSGLPMTQPEAPTTSPRAGRASGRRLDVMA